MMVMVGRAHRAEEMLPAMELEAHEPIVIMRAGYAEALVGVVRQAEIIVARAAPGRN